jgi:uncharacterized membrane protein YjgN (DUF898 family)
MPHHPPLCASVTADGMQSKVYGYSTDTPINLSSSVSWNSLPIKLKRAGPDMNANNYQVIYKGEILPGFEKEAVFQDVAKIMAIHPDTVAKIINGKRLVLKKGLDEATAREQCILFKKAGIRVALGVPQPEFKAESTAAAPSPATQDSPSPDRASGPPAAAAPASAPIENEAPSGGRPQPAATAASARVPFEFNGSGSEYFRIWLVNILLTIITLGIYSAWAKVRNRQYFYGNTRMGGAGFEYLASPAQILRGRALVGGALIAYWGLSIFLPYVEAVFGLAFVFGLPWLIVRSLAFNAHNSAWRNIRFGFSAGYKEAFKIYILWPLLAMVTLGLFSPYVFYRQKQFLVENSSFGQSRFSFHATWKDYYRILMAASLLTLLAVAVVGVAAFTFAPLVLLAVPIYMYLFAYFSVMSGNLFYNSSRLSRHRLESSMEVSGYLWLVVTNILATALTLGIFHPWARVRALRYKMQHLSLLPAGDLNAFVAGKQKAVGAVGDATGDFLDFDLGL